MQAILRRLNFDYRLYGYWLVKYLEILPDDPMGFDYPSNLEEMEFWLQIILLLIIDPGKYLKILPDDPECFDNASNLEEVEFWLQTIWSLIIDRSFVPKDLIWWSWVFWQCEQSWGGRIFKSDYMITDRWSVMCTWRSYMMILRVLAMRSILIAGYMITDHWSVMYLKILPDDPECFDNASNLEKAKVLGSSAHVSCRIFSFNTTQ